MERVALLDGVVIQPLRIIESELGAVRHGMKSSESTFHGFGETYFSIVDNTVTKGWKKHTLMHSNLIVTQGAIRFIIYDDREFSTTREAFMDVTLSPEDSYARLYIPPMLWMAFQGIGRATNMLLNISSIEHDPEECIQAPLNAKGFPSVT